MRSGNPWLKPKALDVASDLMKEAEKSGVKLLLPVDVVVADTIELKSPGISCSD